MEAEEWWRMTPEERDAIKREQEKADALYNEQFFPKE